MKRRAAFIILALAGIALLVAGIKLGDPETIHRFAAQI
jgi:hypothetical protein